MKTSNNYCAEANISEDLRIQHLRAAASVYRDQSKKADGEKLRMELIPTSCFYSLGRVLTHGASKYGANTWQQVEYDRYVGALIRHLLAFIDDPNGVDMDSGLKHTEHLLANAMFLNDFVHAGRILADEKTL